MPTDYQNPAACVAVLIVRSGRLLLAKRGVQPAKGEWDTVGGFVDENESAEDAVVRETLEETGLEVGMTEYLGSVPDYYGPEKRPILHLCFLASVPGGDPVARSDVATLSWLPLAELPDKMAFPNQYRVLRLLNKRMTAGSHCFPAVQKKEPA